MKKNTFILALLLVSMNVFASKNKVIDHPSYEVRSSGIYHISKIELLDTETRLHVHCTFLPNWWVMFSKNDFIKDSNSGKTYQAIGVENAQFDEKYWMPESGESTFVLIFPPLDKGTEKIDFNNYVYGISLKKGKSQKKPALPAKELELWLNGHVKKVSHKQPIEFSSPEFFGRDTARIVGYLKGYDTRLGFSTGIIYNENDLTRDAYPTVLQIYPDGRFEASFLLDYPICSSINIEKYWIPFYIEPGQTLSMVMDWEEFLIADRLRNIRYQFKDIQFGGPLTKINNDLLGYDEVQFDYNAFQKKLSTVSPDEFRSQMALEKQENMEKVEMYIQSNAISSQAIDILRNNVIIENATHMFDFVMNRGYKKREDPSNEILDLPVPDNYYDFLQDIPMNSNSLLALSGFKVFINRFEYCEPLRVSQNAFSLDLKPEDFLDFLDKENLAMPLSDKTLYLELSNPGKISEDSTKLALHSDEMNRLMEKYQDYFNMYSKKVIQPLYDSFLEKIKHDEWKIKDSILINKLHLQPGFIYEITKIRALKFNINRLSREKAYEYWFRLGIDHPFLVATGNEVLRSQFSDEFVAYELPSGSPTEMFKEIIDPFKGKILFVDFWATSCGPCVGTIKDMKEVRKTYKDNEDFDFIFITDDRSSPEKHYTEFVKEQDLANTYRLSKDDYNYLRQLFKFNGIPRYVVIDKNGLVLNDNFPMHNFKHELENILRSGK